MRVSTRFSDAVHIIAFINIYHGKIPLTSDNIAGSIGTSPVVVRRIMSQLNKACILNTKKGTKTPKIARKLSEISLFDIYLAVEGSQQHLFTVDTKTNPACIVGGNIQQVLGQVYDEAEKAAYNKLNQTTMQDVVDDILLRQRIKEQGMR
ncbi:MAG: Rrf2 family transcriptional regulator [Lactobacillus equicursoris]|uniref:Rrf2 family transcriptional regulator n=1 Tax=Lactobacillus equicursoris TaxID=420645 RepID=UPI002430893E|nr:Rrf2 family transcriptional regulator [Lactobacillus equicursoris]MDD6407072.1 Rrf2 family transcriptional regulator [Lactobacillus equicursoris]